MVEEINALEKNGTWIIETLPQAKNPSTASGFIELNTTPMAPLSDIRLDW